MVRTRERVPQARDEWIPRRTDRYAAGRHEERNAESDHPQPSTHNRWVSLITSLYTAPSRSAARFDRIIRGRKISK